MKAPDTALPLGSAPVVPLTSCSFGAGEHQSVVQTKGIPVERVSVEAVVLDMDGLMLDTESIYKRAWQRAAVDCGHIIDDDFYSTLIGQPTDACESAIVERYGPEFPLPAFRLRWTQLWRTEVENSGIPRKPGLGELLAFLGTQQIPIGIATSSDRQFTALSLRAAGLEDRFDQIITGDEVTNGKPAPDIYLEAANRLGVLPEHSVAIEDSDVGALAASAAGMIPIIVPDLNAPSPEARSVAFRVLPSLREARGEIETLLQGELGAD